MKGWTRTDVVSFESFNQLEGRRFGPHGQSGMAPRFCHLSLPTEPDEVWNSVRSPEVSHGDTLTRATATNEAATKDPRDTDLPCIAHKYIHIHPEL